ncbi:conserved protein of unknown function [Tenacibaculum sp. 190130A14a]|uniref:Transcription regulator BetR N-terminal domain-containing protein n=1 Tax=Tenacibaculum polynesiense TaxID=3137857 RepID=A0ABM9PEX9_9FLAO
MNIEIKNLFASIKKKIPDNISMIDEIADTLDINYDAAYRRVKNLTQLTFNEVVVLARHYNISLNTVCNFGQSNLITLERKGNDYTVDSLERFFEEGKRFANIYRRKRNAVMLYAAKELPLYYLPKDSLLMKFRVFSMLYCCGVNKKLLKKRISLSEFKISSSLLYELTCFTHLFKEVECIEFWNDFTIDSTLNLIYYYCGINLLTKEEALKVLDDLEKLLRTIEDQARKEHREGEGGARLEMFYSNLVSLDGSILFKSDNTKGLLIPYGPLSFFKVDDDKTCDEVSMHFEDRTKLSKKISGNSEVERKLFFSRLYLKIKKIYRFINEEGELL